jgi:hypothetical protein
MSRHSESLVDTAAKISALGDLSPESRPISDERRFTV